MKERLEIVAVIEVFGAGSAAARWFADGMGDPLLLIAAAAGVAAVPVTLLLRRRQIRRAHWLATTPDWWMRLDEMPRMEPFPRLVDAVENLGDRLRRGHPARSEEH